MSCDICDAWPVTRACGTGVQQGADPGPLALCLKVISTVSNSYG